MSDLPDRFDGGMSVLKAENLELSMRVRELERALSTAIGILCELGCDDDTITELEEYL